MFHHCLKSKFSKSSSWLLARVLIIYFCLYTLPAEIDPTGWWLPTGYFYSNDRRWIKKWFAIRRGGTCVHPRAKTNLFYHVYRLSPSTHLSQQAAVSTLRRLVRKKTIIILRAVAKFSRQLIFLNDNMQIAVGVRNYNRIVDICWTNYYCGHIIRLFILQWWTELELLHSIWRIALSLTAIEHTLSSCDFFSE